LWVTAIKKRSCEGGYATGIEIEEAATNMPLPLHPGAERHYREIGLIK
jgi:TRAP-type uncharacterized transport system substrate-binding protein